jgi:hypothetical protein
MKNSLLEYLNKRMLHKKPEPQHQYERPPGPVITISREVGCSGIAIAEDLAHRLKQRYPGAHMESIEQRDISGERQRT